MKILLIIIVTIVAVLLIASGVYYFILSKPSPPAEQPTSPREIKPPTEQPTPPVETKPSTERLAPPEESKPPTEQPPLTFEQKIESLKQAVADVLATGEAREITLVITETEANDQAANLLPQAEIPGDIPLEIKGVRIDLQTGNNLLTEIEAVIYGFTGKIEVKSHVSIEEGRPAVEVTDVSVPLPGVKDKIAGLIEQKIEDLLSQLTETALGSDEEVDLEYKEINIQEEKVTITVLIKPRA